MYEKYHATNPTKKIRNFRLNHIHIHVETLYTFIKRKRFYFHIFLYSTKKNHHIPTTTLFHSCKRNPGKTLEIWVPSPPVTMAMTPDYNP